LEFEPNDLSAALKNIGATAVPAEPPADGWCSLSHVPDVPKPVSGVWKLVFAAQTKPEVTGYTHPPSGRAWLCIDDTR